MCSSDRVATAEGAAFGAAVLAATGAGWFPSVGAAAAAMVRATDTVDPGPDAATYDALHREAWAGLYPALRSTSYRLGEA